MPTYHSLLSAGIALALLGHAPAEPETPPRPELPVGEKIERLENAARQLAEAGMMQESVRLRVQVAAMRRDAQQHHQPELAALQTTIEALRDENRMLHQRLEQLEAEARARTAKHQNAPSLDELAAEAHRKQTEETWARIKRAARGERDPAAPADQEHQLLPPRPIPLPSLTPEAAPPTTQDLVILQDILCTLQRIEAKLKD